mgnify:CR=1 FL=1
MAEDQKTTNLKANYNQMVTSVARNVYLKLHESVRDFNEAKIRDEDKNEIRLYMIGMIVGKWWEFVRSLSCGMETGN